MQCVNSKAGAIIGSIMLGAVLITCTICTIGIAKSREQCDRQFDQAMADFDKGLYLRAYKGFMNSGDSQETRFFAEQAYVNALFFEAVDKLNQGYPMIAYEYLNTAQPYADAHPGLYEWSGYLPDLYARIQAMTISAITEDIEG